MGIFMHLFAPLCNLLDLGIQPLAALASLRSPDNDARAHTAVSIVDLTDDYCAVHRTHERLGILEKIMSNHELPSIMSDYFRFESSPTYQKVQLCRVLQRTYIYRSR
jgi:thiaminase